MSDKESKQLLLTIRTCIALVILGAFLYGPWGAVAGYFIGRVVATVLCNQLTD